MSEKENRQARADARRRGVLRQGLPNLRDPRPETEFSDENRAAAEVKRQRRRDKRKAK